MAATTSTTIYYIESSAAAGRQEEIYGPDAAERAWTSREAAEAMLADLRDDPAYPGVEYSLEERALENLPDWVREIL